jgi:adenine phosphoribosyltransferase
MTGPCAPPPDHYALEIAGIRRRLPVVAVEGGVAIAVLNILGDTELVEAAARELAHHLRHRPYDVFLTAEAKSIPLAHALSVVARRPYVVLRKIYKSYMGDALHVTTRSITTGHEQVLYLDAKDRTALAGRAVVLLDDVISTGSTLEGLRSIARAAEARVVAEAAIATEGDAARWREVIALAHLPVFRSGSQPSAV